MVSSECLPVSGSSALTSNWLRPRRRSTGTDQRPVESAVTPYGSRPGVATLTVAPAIVMPRRVYEVMVSSTSTTAAAGSVTATVGGFAKRRSCTPR